jgi:hypothetical protein
MQFGVADDQRGAMMPGGGATQPVSGIALLEARRLCEGSDFGVNRYHFQL